MARIVADRLIEGLTFDDVLLRPGHSVVLPADVDIKTKLTRSIGLNLPIIASAMDTVTEAAMAIAMAQNGGLGVIHRNLEPDAQAEQVRQVKKYESGMVMNPITIHPDETLSAALALMKRHGISGIPVDHAEPAVLRHGDGHGGFRDRVHRRGDDRQVEADRAGEAGGDVHVGRQDLGAPGPQQHVVEGEAVDEPIGGDAGHRPTPGRG